MMLSFQLYPIPLGFCFVDTIPGVLISPWQTVEPAFPPRYPNLVPWHQPGRCVIERADHDLCFVGPERE